MEFSFDFKMTEENKKVIEEILKQKGVKHYVLEKKDKEKLDLVEYKDYKELEKEKQELIDYLKEEQNRLARETSAVYEDGLGKRKLVNEEIYNEVSKILSKIERNDK